MDTLDERGQGCRVCQGAQGGQRRRGGSEARVRGSSDQHIESPLISRVASEAQRQELQILPVAQLGVEQVQELVAWQRVTSLQGLQHAQPEPKANIGVVLVASPVHEALRANGGRQGMK